jgi:ABC-2 type transport system permease protein
MSPVLRASWLLAKREMLRFVRQRSRIIGALATPVLFWIVVGGGLGTSFRDPNGLSQASYLQYFFPGAVTLSVLFTAIFSTMSVIEDRHQGFLQGILVSPVSRMSFVLGKMLGGSLLASVQVLLLMGLAPFAGYTLTWLSVGGVLLFAWIVALGLTGLGFFFAWKMDSVQGYHGIMNTVLMPLWMLSGAVFPAGAGFKAFDWLRLLNPVSYAVSGMRSAFEGRGFLWTDVVVVSLFAIGTGMLSCWEVQQKQNQSA